MKRFRGFGRVALLLLAAAFPPTGPSLAGAPGVDATSVGPGVPAREGSPAGAGTFPDLGADVVALRVGEHRFRIPRAYFRHPPPPSGVGIGFYVRALWPGMEPETEANRAAFRASIRTEEGQRVLLILLKQNQPGMPWPVARWMLQNAAHGPSREEADRADLEAFAPASPETFGLRALLGRPKPGPGSIDDDLLHGALADGRFAGMHCGRDRDPDRLTSCNLWFDWRQGTRVEVMFIRTQLPKWREIAEATLALVDGYAAEDGGR